jgi:transposase
MSTANDFAAFVGIDWGDDAHAVCLFEIGSQRVESFTLEQDSDALDQWIAKLRLCFGDRPIAICLEQSRGALIYALLKYENLVLFPINPKQLAKYREAMKPSGSKDDPSDAQLLCEFVRQQHGKLKAWQPDDETTRSLRLLTEQRRNWVQKRTAIGNQLIQRLKESYDLAWKMCGSRVYSDAFLALLAKFPTQRELQRASPRQLERCLPKYCCVPDADGQSTHDADRIKAIRQARPLTTDAAVLFASRLEVRNLVATIQQLNVAIAEYDREIAKLLARHPDAELFTSLPGAGEALTPRLIAAFGTDRSRYETADELQEFSGVAPITVRSGRSLQVRMRRACPKFVRQTFHEFARCSLGKSRWARAYYAMMRARGCRVQAAIRALAFKWIRIIFRCWKTREPYNEARYLQRLREKRSPILAYLADAVPIPGP